MKIGLFGGRFDPVHNGHIAIAREILKLMLVDQVWFIPDLQHQWNPIIAPVGDRLNMLKLAVKNEQNIMLDTIAIDLGGSTEIYKVLQHLKRRYADEFVFIGGSDQLRTLSQWHYWAELVQTLPFLIVVR